MYLKSLTVKGFKSFASATTLKLEPGITCVVGPNGSGKSNVVDAIAWVLGEQGAKALRGGKMEDVIFAGTAGRAPLGRAEVTLTIDNTDGALPIEYTEVSITRRMFRSGESEYEINGDSCRLLDIQELLSDSGIGREMHIIVGQGRLDGMLHAKPEDRRAFIEEAAGVLKHRKRKEKALRKLDAMQTNLNRLTDLTAELRRQLKPLGRQAEVARRAAVIQANLRDARLRLLADDLATLRTTLDKEIADETALRQRREQVEAEHAEVQSRLGELEEALASDAPLLAAAQDTWYKLSALQERFRSIEQLAVERLRHLTATPDDERPGRDPEQLEAEAERVREQEEELRAALTDDQVRLAEAVEHRQAVRSAGRGRRAVHRGRPRQRRPGRPARGGRRRPGAGTGHGPVAVGRGAGSGEGRRDLEADAVAVTGVDEAVEAMRLLKISDAGRAGLLVGSPAGPGMSGSADALRPKLPDGAHWAPDLVDCDDQIRPAVHRALRDVVLVADLSAAAEVVTGNPELRAVTREGDVVGAYAAAGGSAKAPSYIEVQAAVEEARASRLAAERTSADLREQLVEARAEVATAKEAVRHAAAAKREAESHRNAAARRLAELGAAARSAKAETDRLGESRARAEAARERDLTTLAELEERLRLAEATPIDAEPSTEERDQFAAMVPQARQNEMEVRLAVRTAEERVASIAGRADSLRRQAGAERAARERR